MTAPGQHTTPCGTCPFLKKQAGMITGGAAQDFVRSFLQDRHFTCHKTLGHDEDGNTRITDKSRLCAGMLTTCVKGGHHLPQLARVSLAIGMFKFEDIAESKADVFSSYAAFIAGHRNANALGKRTRKAS